MKKTCPNAFSLMEMMIVLLIVAIIAAATAPMVTKKMTRHANPSAENGESLWERVADSEMIQPINGHRDGLRFDTSVAIGDNIVPIDMANSNIAIGNGVGAQGNRSIAIGSTDSADKTGDLNTRSIEDDSIAIGTHAVAQGKNSIAIGKHAVAQGDYSIAIGIQTTDNQCWAIGDGDIDIANKFSYVASSKNIYIGDANDTVTIHGDLIVQGNVMLNTSKSKSATFFRGWNNGDENSQKLFRLIGYTEGRDTWGYDSGDSDNRFTVNRSYSGSTSITALYSNLNSDIRLKNVGEKFEAGLEELKKLDLFNYTFKDDVNKTPRVGVMAQDLQKVFPNAVTEGEDGYLRIRMEDMFYAVINAVKELDTRLNILVGQVKMYFDKVNSLEAKVEAQQQEIESLKAQNAEFEERLAKLEKRRK